MLTTKGVELTRRKKIPTEWLKLTRLLLITGGKPKKCRRLS